MIDILIQEGTPSRTGLYVAYVNGDVSIRAERKFLMWMDRWSYPGSDQNFRGHVYGWIGPLPTMELEP